MRHLAQNVRFRLGGSATCLAVLLGWSAPAFAVPQVEILSPSAGDCVNAGLGVVDGQPPGGGGDPAFLPDVPLRLRLSESEGAPLEITVQVDGVQVAQSMVEAPGAQPFETDQVFIPGASLADGVGRVIQVQVRAGDQSAQDQVVADFDRAAPEVIFAEADLALFETCADPAPALDIQVRDDVDADPQVSTSVETDGCRVEQVIQVEDACGNGQRVRFATRRPPPGPVTPIIDGVAAGAEVISAEVRWRVEQPNDCVIGQQTDLIRDGVRVGALISGGRVDDEGAYRGVVSVTVCGQADPIEASLEWTVLPRPRADVGGPYVAPEGAELFLDASASQVDPAYGDIVEYAWDVDADNVFSPLDPVGVRVPFDTLQGDGVYPIGLRITTASGHTEFAFGEVIIEDVLPNCVAGGPYEIEQGVGVELDARASTAGHPSEPILYYDWDFGDARFPQRSLDAQPVHHYLVEGDWTVTLTLGDRDSEVQCTAEVRVLDVSPEVREFGVAEAPGAVFFEGDALRFTAGQSTAGSAAEPITNFHWAFGDGATLDGLDERGPQHTYVDDGEFLVCLEVQDQDSSDRACVPVTVADLAPVARLFAPAFADEGEAVTLSAIGSRAGGEADPLSRYVFSFGDGSPPVEIRDLEQTEVRHTFVADGELTISVEVFDEDSSTVATRTLFVGDAVPTAELVVLAGASVPEGTEVGLDASGSAAGAPSDPIVGYAWDFGDGATAAGPDLAQVRHAWPDEGTYTVRVSVIDEDGSRASRARQVRVTNLAPQGVAIAGPEVLEVNQLGVWRMSFRDAEGDSPTVEWRTGDGRTVRNRGELSHRYAAPGFYQQVVVVDDGDGGVTSARLSVLVTAAAPRLAGPDRLDGREGAALAFQIEAAPARIDNQTLDGPLALHVIRAPAGLAWTQVDAADPEDGATLDFRWTPGPTDAGTHLVRLLARAPSGIERTHDVQLEIAETGEARLLASTGDGRLTIYQWRADPLRGQSVFEPVSDSHVGRLRSVAIDVARGLAVGASHDTGALQIIDLRRARLVRSAPCFEAPTSVSLGPDHAFSFDTSGRLSAMDLDTLKPVSQVRDDRFRAVIDSAWLPSAASGLPRDRLIALTTDGGLLVIDPEAALDRQVDYETLELGGEANRLIVHAGRLRVARRRPADVLTVDVALALAGDEDAVDSAPLVFAAHDLAAGPGGLWLATGRGVEWLADDGEPEARIFGAVGGLVALPDDLYGQPAVAVGLGNQVETFGLDGQVLDSGRHGGAVQLGFAVLP